MEPYDHKVTEKKLLEFWKKEKTYKFDEKSKKKIFSIDTPPPTVSGEMHIGHACSYSQQDFIARYKRMNGFNVFYPFGTDDNGLPTERLVEKKKGVKSKEMLRADFIKLCQEFLKEELPKFIQDWKDIGISCDFNLLYSTIDSHSRKISQWSFLDLYKKGRLYRKDAPSMWCPECRTGVSQVEVQDKELDSIFNDIVFKLGKENLVVGTTRPEFLPACVSLFFNPEDKRYKKYLGRKAKVPLFDFEVQIREDSRVKMDKGTGLVMCCTFGDQTDMEWQKAYNLEIKTAIDEKGHMTEIAGKYKGLYLKTARKEILNDLTQANLLISQKPIKHIVNVHERCGTGIEFIKNKQWFVKYLDLKKDMLKWGKEIKWYPEHMKHRYDNWVNGLQWDWLISNQRYFGVSFPVWYCKKCGEVVLAEESQLPVDPQKDKPKNKCTKCKSNEFVPEMDVLNTWFTSSMTPQIVTRLVKNDKLQKKIFPMSLRPQSHDIITFWTFNTMVKSQLHYGKNPWKEVALSGFVTLEGEKMSKSKGNVIRPQEVMEKYGADAIRFWAASSKLGEDFDYQEKDVVTGKKFVNKLLNACNFAFMNMKDYKPKKPKKMEDLDELFLTDLNRAVLVISDHFKNYEYSRAKLNIEELFWKLFCDNYLEIVKWRVYNGSKEEKASAFYTIYTSLLTIIKLVAPITPFITEHLYQEHFRKFEKDKSIHISEWPKFDDKKHFDRWVEKEAAKETAVANRWLLLVREISNIRRIKSENQKAMNSEIYLTLEKNVYKHLKPFLEDLKRTVNAKEIKEGEFKVEFV